MKIKFAILGCGDVAQRHAEHISNHPEASLSVVYDVIKEKGQALAEKFGVSVAKTADEMWQDDYHIVSICTPNGLHCQNALDAMQHGKHVLVEKPMALSVSECERMVDISMRFDKKLFVVKQNRYNPPVQAVKRIVEEGCLGRILSVQVNCYWNRNELYYKKSNWKGTKSLDGGTLFTQFSHFVDILYYLLGEIRDIQGYIINANHGKLIEFEDTGFFTFRFGGGAIGSFNYTTCCYEQNLEGSITIFAENATIKIGGQYLNTIDYQKTRGFDITDLPASGPANDYGFYRGSMSNHDKVIDNVVETLNGRQTIMTNALEGLKVVGIIEKMYAAAK